MIKIGKRGKGYRLTIITPDGDKVVYDMTQTEYTNLVLKGWEDYAKMACKYAKTFCKYSTEFCKYAEEVCKNYTFTLKKKR